MQVFSYFLRFLILKNQNNIFETLKKSENLALIIDLAYKNSRLFVKTDQQCSMTHIFTNPTQKFPLVDCLIAILYHITKIILIIDFWRSPWHLQFRINLRAYLCPLSLQIFFVVKITLGLAISSIIFILEVLVLSNCFYSFVDQTGQGTQIPSKMAIFSVIFTHKTPLLEPITHFPLPRYEIAYIWCMTTLTIQSDAWKKIASVRRKVWMEIAWRILLHVIYRICSVAL